MWFLLLHCWQFQQCSVVITLSPTQMWPSQMEKRGDFKIIKSRHCLLKTVFFCRLPIVGVVRVQWTHHLQHEVVLLWWTRDWSCRLIFWRFPFPFTTSSLEKFPLWHRKEKHPGFEMKGIIRRIKSIKTAVFPKVTHQVKHKLFLRSSAWQDHEQKCVCVCFWDKSV